MRTRPMSAETTANLTVAPGSRATRYGLSRWPWCVHGCLHKDKGRRVTSQRAAVCARRSSPSAVLDGRQRVLRGADGLAHGRDGPRDGFAVVLLEQAQLRTAGRE